MKLIPKFVDLIPAGKPPSDVMYVSMKYGVISYLCPCGCGETHDVNLAPKRWNITTDGEHVTIRPSIQVRGTCESHYFITNNEVVWA